MDKVVSFALFVCMVASPSDLDNVTWVHIVLNPCASEELADWRFPN
jgi:hypothetical protein